jgi:thiamine pyrophosphokinase
VKRGRDPVGPSAVFLNGDYEDDRFYVARFHEAGLVIAADGGHAFLRRQGLWPHLLVGDFDSLDAGLVAEAEAQGIEVERSPVRKDETDAELAVAAAEARSGGEVVLLGALGGGLDHALGHLSVLRGCAQRGRAARILAPGFAACVLFTPVKVTLAASEGTRVSLVALSPAAVVTLRGFEYEVTNAPLPAASCVGLGNAVASAGARIELSTGVLAVLVFDDSETFAG